MTAAEFDNQVFQRGDLVAMSDGRVYNLRTVCFRSRCVGIMYQGSNGVVLKSHREIEKISKPNWAPFYLYRIQGPGARQWIKKPHDLRRVLQQYNEDYSLPMTDNHFLERTLGKNMISDACFSFGFSEHHDGKSAMRGEVTLKQFLEKRGHLDQFLATAHDC